MAVGYCEKCRLIYPKLRLECECCGCELIYDGMRSGEDLKKLGYRFFDGGEPAAPAEQEKAASVPPSFHTAPPAPPPIGGSSGMESAARPAEGSRGAAPVPPVPPAAGGGFGTGSTARPAAGSRSTASAPPAPPPIGGYGAEPSPPPAGGEGWAASPDPGTVQTGERWTVRPPEVVTGTEMGRATPPAPRPSGRRFDLSRLDMRLIAQAALVILGAAALLAVIGFVYINRYMILQSVSTALGVGLVIAIVIVVWRLSRPFRWWW